jgi:hypothetical protein
MGYAKPDVDGVRVALLSPFDEICIAWSRSLL